MSRIYRIPTGPFYEVNMFMGGFPRPAENPNGHANWWNVNPDADISLVDGNHGMRLYANSVETAVENLEERIKYGYDRGARHFFLNRPMGTTGFHHVSAASWETIEETKRTAMALKMKSIANGLFGEPVDLVPFIGSGFRAADSLAGWEGPDDPNDGWLLGNGQTADEQAADLAVFNGWLVEAGCAGLFIDHSSPENERDHFMALSDTLWDTYGTYMAGEALPVETDPDGVPFTQRLDESAVNEFGWIATHSYFSHPNGEYSTRPYLDVRTDPATTRVFTRVDNPNLDTEEDYIAAWKYHVGLGRYIVTNNITVLVREINRLAQPGSPVNCVAWDRDPDVTFKAMHESIVVDPRSYGDTKAEAERAAEEYVALAEAQQAAGFWGVFRFWKENNVGDAPLWYDNDDADDANHWYNQVGAFESQEQPDALTDWWGWFIDAVNADQSFKIDYALHDFENNVDIWAVPSEDHQAFFEPITIDDGNNPYPYSPNPYIGENIWTTGTSINDQFIQEYGEWAQQDRTTGLQALTGELVIPSTRYSNYLDRRLKWNVGNVFNRHNREPVPSTLIGNVSCPVVYLDYADNWSLFTPEAEYTTQDEQDNRRRWMRMLYKLNEARSCAAHDDSEAVHPWIAPPGYGAYGSDTWSNVTQLPFEKMLWRASMAHLIAMGIDIYCSWNPSSIHNPNAQDTDEFMDAFFHGLRTTRDLDRTLPQIHDNTTYYTNIESVTTNGVTTAYADLYEISTLYYARSLETVVPYMHGFGTATQPLLINTGAAGDAELAAMLTAINANQGSTPSSQEVNVRSQIIGVANGDANIAGVTISADQAITGEFNVYVKRASDGSIVTTDINVEPSSVRTIYGTSASPTSVSQGDQIGIETVSVSPDVSLRASVNLVPVAASAPV